MLDDKNLYALYMKLERKLTFSVAHGGGGEGAGVGRHPMSTFNVGATSDVNIQCRGDIRCRLPACYSPFAFMISFTISALVIARFGSNLFGDGPEIIPLSHSARMYGPCHESAISRKKLFG